MEDENKPEEVPAPPPAVDYSQPPAPGQWSAAPQPPQNDALGQIIPTKNPYALFAYYCAVFALVPCFTPLLAPAAVILGCLGLREINRRPGLPGKAHALVGIILGGLLLLVTVGLVVAFLLAPKS